jgi:hypothetical protein
MSTPQPGFGVTLRGDGMQVHYLCKLQAAAWKAGYEKMMAEVALENATALYKHSFPAPGNDPLKGNSGGPEAYQQGQYNLTKDINSMFYPIGNHSVRDLVGMRNRAVFQIDNPIQWQDPDLEKAWQAQDMDILFMAFQTLGTDTGESDYLNLEKTNFNEVSADTVNYIETPNEEIHQSSMRNGRWDGRTKTAVRSRAAIQTFLSQKMKSIGRSANGWVDCIKKLGGQINALMPGKGLGTVDIKRDATGIKYVLTNAYGNPNGMADDAIAKVIQETNATFIRKTKELVDMVAKVKPPPNRRNRGRPRP